MANFFEFIVLSQITTIEIEQFTNERFLPDNNILLLFKGMVYNNSSVNTQGKVVSYFFLSVLRLKLPGRIFSSMILRAISFSMCIFPFQALSYAL